MKMTYGEQYRHKKAHKKPQRCQEIVVPLNPNEKIEIRFYFPDKSKVPVSWFGDTERLKEKLGLRGE